MGKMERKPIHNSQISLNQYVLRKGATHSLDEAKRL
jgi:hypothetical protein